MIQGGDPAGDGSGGPGYSVEEAPDEDLKYEEGVVAMAKTGAEPAGTSGSQFFIVTGAGAASLTPDYALLGKVTKGMDVATQDRRHPGRPEHGSARRARGHQVGHSRRVLGKAPSSSSSARLRSGPPP